MKDTIFIDTAFPNCSDLLFSLCSILCTTRIVDVDLYLPFPGTCLCACTEQVFLNNIGKATKLDQISFRTVDPTSLEGYPFCDNYA